jgi:hypothetical protein
MVPLAPRYDARIVSALRALDDPKEPMAEICRRVGDVASRLGLTRPSYVHVRRLLLAERTRRAIIRAVTDAVVWRLAVGLLADPFAASSRLRYVRAPRTRSYAPRWRL